MSYTTQNIFNKAEIVSNLFKYLIPKLFNNFSSSKSILLKAKRVNKAPPIQTIDVVTVTNGIFY